MSSFSASQVIVEIAKFGVYLAVPASLMYAFSNNFKNRQRVIGNHSYIVYPSDAERPQSPEELREMAREIAQKKNLQ